MTGRNEGEHQVILRMLLHVLEAQGPAPLISRAVRTLGMLPSVERVDYTEAHGLRVRFKASCSPEARTRVAEVVAVVRAVHARELAIQRLTADAHTDPLTGLYNRRGFQPFVDQALARARRSGEKVSLVLCDVDHFKTINDRFGHKRGDQALKAITTAIGQALRPTDIAARLGGDELALLLSGADALGAQAAAERLRAAVASANPFNGMPLTLSMGVADLEALPAGPLDDWQARDALFRAADEALYAAKKRGRDCAVCHPSCFTRDDVCEDVTRPIVIRAA